MGPQAVKLIKMAIIDCMVGNEKYKELVNTAMEISKEEPKLAKCKYKINGYWIPARVNFSNGVIVGLDGNILRRGHIPC